MVHTHQQRPRGHACGLQAEMREVSLYVHTRGTKLPNMSRLPRSNNGALLIVTGGGGSLPMTKALGEDEG